MWKGGDRGKRGCGWNVERVRCGRVECGEGEMWKGEMWKGEMFKW